MKKVNVQMTLMGAIFALVLPGMVAMAFWEVDAPGSLLYCLILGALGATIRDDMADVSFDSLGGGALMAGVTYLLFLGGILTGDGGGGLLTSNTFPSFTTTTESSVAAFITVRPVSIESTAKLLIWCFMSGYSRTFAVGMLKRMKQSSD